MMYQERHSAIRKIISDSVFLFLFFVLLLSSSFMIWNGDTEGKPPEIVRIFLSIVFFLGALLFLYSLIHQITRAKRIRSNWLIELGSEFIRLGTPDDEVEPFEYEHKKIKKLSREAYSNDGIWYEWFIYIENGSTAIKMRFDLGPFMEEKIADKIKHFYDIDVVEVDIEGVTREWKYSLLFKIKELFGSIFAAVILAFIVVPGCFYLVKVINNVIG